MMAANRWWRMPHLSFFKPAENRHSARPFAAGRTAAREQANRKRGMQGLHVLVVEDEALIALLMEDWLREAGIDVVGPCATVAEALKATRENPVSAATLDFRLSGETTEVLADTLARLGVPFIFCSGEPIPHSLLKKWPDSVLVTKPTTSACVVQALAEATQLK